MALQSFAEAYKNDNQPFTVSINDNDYKGFTEAEFQKLLSEFNSKWCGAGTYNIAYDYREGSTNNKYRPYGDETQFEGESSEELCQLFFDFLREDRVCPNDIIDVYIYKVSEEI